MLDHVYLYFKAEGREGGRNYSEQPYAINSVIIPLSDEEMETRDIS